MYAFLGLFIAMTTAVNVTDIESPQNETTIEVPAINASTAINALISELMKLRREVSTNAGKISTNTGKISTLTGKISTNTGKISTNTGKISTNTGNINTKLAKGSFNTGGIRLVDSSGNINYRAGRLEVKHENVWGTVCDDGSGAGNTQSGHSLGEVVCYMLGYERAGGYTTNKAEYGAGSGKIWLDDVKCTGSEKTIYDCSHAAWGTENCDHSEDVGVYCR